ncbi:MAG: dihydroorotate dehydrogenase (quinone) [Candidatus Harrisonbacteria bacterium CG10_big_fil_rev_8_21_14_0_10_38_8]|uniref:Dihydroorotate dehydrogenase (quinone) n=1 Tax=Candidatus Harrisonbacteria bacterium CG10_big_fil_rev_8_21_14_0_10_38_8 TaxID=1974582 RepID=A0A2M6WKG8_9BACT|nr:MAG: dihydroorotate dehydrogenase (quinone) [Candidatus Harrisonbacteria bacterium CG10_big_fil_rev_8_21_14_0_10_38_8]
MASMYKYFLKPVLFLFPPDWTHFFVVKFSSLIFKIPLLDKIISPLFTYNHPLLEREILGIKFKNPIGLGGGFDKDVELTHVMPILGFGFMDIGSITAKPYQGNKRPWNVRLPKDKALIVNYGLKNQGVDHAVQNLKQSKKQIPIIANIAKTNNPDIHGQASVDDYLASFKKLEPYADLININISCPNTGDGVLFCEDSDLLANLLEALQKAHNESVYKKPILLKLKPDLSDEQLNALLDLVGNYDCIKGFVVSNLTRSREVLAHSNPEAIAKFPGGISGRGVQKLSTEMIKKIKVVVGDKYTIIGLGGVFTATDAYEKLQAGADLIQLVTGLIFEGPSVVKEINKGLVKIWQRKEMNSF